MNKALLAGMIGLAVVLFGAPAASASTATVSGGDTVRVTATANETNALKVTYTMATDIYTVTDSASNITPSGTCIVVDTHTVTCPGLGIKNVTVNAGAKNDIVVLDRQTIPTTIAGDLDGGSGDDSVIGAKGKEDVKGGSGKDMLDGSEGADEINGGSGTDTLLYSTRITPVNVTIGSGNDNDGNELDLTGTVRDTVKGDVEMVLGGIAGDTVTGDNSSETLNGGDGPDILIGNGGGDDLLGFGGDDFLSGGNGDDTERGSLGNDRMFGGPDEDLLAGGADNDTLAGENGVDRMKGKTGIDVIRARDGTRDIKINCGPGPNRLEFAKRDKRLDPKARRC